MDVKIETSWKKKLDEEFTKPYFSELATFIKQEYKTREVYPPGKYIFHAFEMCPLEKVKVVILGQDPYHGPGQAHGLCFSVQKGVPMPPSLLNIFKEINSDLGKKMPADGHLDRWAAQGVLLLNTTLTVRKGGPGSHQGRGWEIFTDRVIQLISAERSGVVFLLWGAHAGKKSSLIDSARHYILKAPHPSPLSAHRGFLGCGHFSKANAFLKENGEVPINW